MISDDRLVLGGNVLGLDALFANVDQQEVFPWPAPLGGEAAHRRRQVTPIVRQGGLVPLACEPQVHQLPWRVELDPILGLHDRRN